MLRPRIRTDGFVAPASPTLAVKPPSGPDWVHEIKHDGYRLIVRRDGAAVRDLRFSFRAPDLFARARLNEFNKSRGKRVF